MSVTLGCLVVVQLGGQVLGGWQVVGGVLVEEAYRLQVEACIPAEQPLLVSPSNWLKPPAIEVTPPAIQQLLSV